MYCSPFSFQKFYFWSPAHIVLQVSKAFVDYFFFIYIFVFNAWNVVFVVLLMLVRSCFLFHKTILNECAQIEANSPWKYGPNTFYGNEYTDSFKARKFYYQVRLKEARYGKIPIRTLGFTSGLPCHMIFQYSGTNIWYALLTKLVRPRWLDIGRVLFFFAFLRTGTKSWSIKTQKENEVNIQPSWLNKLVQ